MDGLAIAKAAADAMWADDNASRGLGMRLDRVGPGTAVLSMEITAQMVNGLGVCHGGFVFTLADSACAFASNSYNQRMLLQSSQITLIAPARLGMRLVAEASERHRTERSGIYDVSVRSEAGEAIAEFRGHVRSVPGKLV
ncbi:MAG: hydroxyphenylacetyl-CoA thioesterase PaaI [Hyphomicrobiaceae bacterium]|nr:hydroxyphenylacetyl-CoA thioesterase PaaI [Hyphomicrobiaceae bacterium]